MTAAYLAAQSLGEPWQIPSVAPNLTYTEQFKPTSINNGILSKPLNITSHRSFYDDVLCTAFTQYLVMDPTHPYVIGTRFEADGLYLTKIETLVTDQGDWAFNATGYKYWDDQEDWSEIPQDKRDKREVIQAAGDAYFNRFANENVSVPWGTPCARLEGGAYTGTRNLTANTCDLGLPSTINVVDRRYVVDQVNGVVVIYLGFPGLDRDDPNPSPDSHAFRVEGGKIRYIHTLSTCEGHPGCGFNGTGPPPSRRL
ncbi:uncharacterized protein N0V89_010343 [Didymosphaeria variabile]|uniref:DUF8021 domain-containing protein n=1 Tax=Didymosphaeria variabile TaxID=1932322 RepID=A0A9W9C628_9PLEO|nr:uncharacterized protein N0V89_010343 [Didymosphaeria variabile]KAJ4346414.1 hypothetical protein N0V89_010343 [Didymosphaeria variabile]